jgi:hypothetical protein
VVPAGAGPTDRWVRSSDMDKLISRKNRDMLHFDKVEWPNVWRQDRRVPDGTRTHRKDSNRKKFSNTDTIIGVVYVGVLIILMLVYLT